MIKILVIDDDPTIRYLVKTILEDVGYHVLHASGGDEGLHLLHTHSPIDMVITDILMPGTDGLAVIREVMTVSPSTKMIALSGGGMILTAETSLHIARKMGAFESLAKPFVRKDLLELVKRVLHSGTEEPDATPRQTADH